MWGKSKAKKCPECLGNGFIQAVIGELAADGNSINVSGNTGYFICSRCRGVGIVGIKELTRLTATQLKKLAENKTVNELMAMFDGKTANEINQIIKAGC